MSEDRVTYDVGAAQAAIDPTASAVLRNA